VPPRLATHLRAGLASDPFGASALSRKEVVLAGALFGLLAAATYFGHVRGGGWYYDDWIIISALELRDPGTSAFEAVQRASGSHRPGSVSVWAALHALGGRGQAPYLLVGVGLVAVEAFLAYIVLRLARIARIVAVPAAAMLTVVPVIDSLRLWTMMFTATVAVILMLAGFATSLVGMRLSRIRTVAVHAAALVLYAGSILTYELVAAPILVAVLLYRLVVPWRSALRRWAADVLVVGVSVAFMADAAREVRPPETSTSFMLDRAEQMVRPAADVFGSLLPAERLLLGPGGLSLLGLGLAGCVAAVVRRDQLAGAIRHWTLVALGGLLFAVAGFVMLLPADPYFIPRLEGVGNRTSGVAVLGAIVLLVALLWLVAAGIASLLRRPAVASPVAAAALAVTAIGMFETELVHQHAWASSWQQSQAVVSAIRTSVGPDVPPGTGIVTFRHTQFTVPGDVPVFAADWDLQGAVRLLYNDRSVRGYPWKGDGDCSARGLKLGAPPWPGGVLQYRRLWFVDATAFRARRIDSELACLDAIGKLTGTPPR